MNCLPQTQRFVFSEPLLEGHTVEFRLIYKGPLPPESRRPHPNVKHAIRKTLHAQLAELWKQEPLRSQLEEPLGKTSISCGRGNSNALFSTRQTVGALPGRRVYEVRIPFCSRSEERRVGKEC